MKVFALISLLGVFFSSAQLAFCQITLLDKPQREVIGSYKVGSSPELTELELAMTIFKFGADMDTTYSLMFRNNRYTQITEYEAIGFPDLPTLRQFKEIVMGIFRDGGEDGPTSFRLNEFGVIGDQADEKFITVFGMKSSYGVTSCFMVDNFAYYCTSQKGWEKVWEKL